MSVPQATTLQLRTRLDLTAETVGMLARAFFDDPLMVYAVPDESQRERILQWFFKLSARYTERHGALYTASDGGSGAALWLPPGKSMTTLPRLILAGFLLGPIKLGLGPLRRFTNHSNHMEHLHKQRMRERHWYLWVLGVEPRRQGLGLGSSLIAPILYRADRDGLPCYLETAAEGNVGFYRRHGFCVLDEGDVPKGGPHYWTMRREPGG